VGYIEKNLVPGETVLYKTRLHWIVLVWPLFAGLLLAGVALALLVGGYEVHLKGAAYSALMIVTVLLFLTAVVLVSGGLIRRNATEIAVSNMRVLIKTGLLARKSIEVMLAKVESIGVEESASGRMLGYGTVIVRGTGGTFETFTRIAHPNEFRRQVQQQIGTR
jgi:uncharacterized membrane protein YdbT with pleckstrin-like domain